MPSVLCVKRTRMKKHGYTTRQDRIKSRSSCIRIPLWLQTKNRTLKHLHHITRRMTLTFIGPAFQKLPDTRILALVDQKTPNRFRVIGSRSTRETKQILPLQLPHPILPIENIRIFRRMEISRVRNCKIVRVPRARFD
ncbi:hypothetical protein HanRHA438_Chr10g0434391 [Helianthus annuus]|nr:hypothetical protein HanRHA438_Chr10g0434391 [Helianthus annuus]